MTGKRLRHILFQVKLAKIPTQIFPKDAENGHFRGLFWRAFETISKPTAPSPRPLQTLESLCGPQSRPRGGLAAKMPVSGRVKFSISNPCWPRKTPTSRAPKSSHAKMREGCHFQAFSARKRGRGRIFVGESKKRPKYGRGEENWDPSTNEGALQPLIYFL